MAIERNERREHPDAILLAAGPGSPGASRDAALELQDREL
jgi:hypothetical protein